MRTGEFHVFHAKAVIIATGMDQMRLFKAMSGDWFNSQSPPYITGDGEAMALRAGAEVFILPGGKTTNAGFQYFRNLFRSSGTATTSYPAGRFVNSDGEIMIKHPAVREPLRKRREEVEQSIRDGKTPFYLDLTDATEEEIQYAEWSYSNEGLCWVILEIMKDLGLDFRRDALELNLEPTGMLTGGFLALFIDTDCRTSLPGLYACSPVQFAGEVAAPTYTVLGWRSGGKAAVYAKGIEVLSPDVEQVELEEKRLTAPGPDGCHSWQEVNKEVNNIMEAYCGYVAGWNLPGEKSEVSWDGLRNCIEQLEKLKVVSLRAENPHELVRCNEVMNIIDLGIMMSKAALEPGQYERGNWFLGKLANGEIQFRKTPIVVKYPPKEES
jgi:succinate dehydrogenase/fumarate reductase flavoprotein subunit